jgi:ABC-2 type transport system ATP-binding protein
VNLHVPKGGIFGLLGPNGAGKTTIIKILSTLVLPDSGKACVEGIDVVKQPEAALKNLQTVLAGNEGFTLRLSGRNNLEFFAELYDIPARVARTRIDELLEFMHLTEFADAMVQKYSTGMMRRLLVCRALLSSASVLLFDEPTASLDPISASEFRRLMENLVQRENKTILLATHNLLEAEQLCDRIALLRKGKVLATGTPDEMRGKVAGGVIISMTISNCLNGSAERAIDVIRRVDGVVKAEIEDRGRDIVRLHIEGLKGLDYNAVFGEVISMKLEIQSIEASHPSLEQAFLKLNEEAVR